MKQFELDKMFCHQSLCQRLSWNILFGSNFDLSTSVFSSHLCCWNKMSDTFCEKYDFILYLDTWTSWSCLWYEVAFWESSDWPSACSSQELWTPSDCKHQLLFDRLKKKLFWFAQQPLWTCHLPPGGQGLPPGSSGHRRGQPARASLMLNLVTLLMVLMVIDKVWRTGSWNS